MLEVLRVWRETFEKLGERTEAMKDTTGLFEDTIARMKAALYKTETNVGDNYRGIARVNCVQ